MDGRKVTIDYDPLPERALARVTLARFGVPERVLDREIPLRRTWGRRVVLDDP